MVAPLNGSQFIPIALLHGFKLQVCLSAMSACKLIGVTIMDGRILSYPSNIVSIEPPPATEIENKNIPSQN